MTNHVSQKQRNAVVFTTSYAFANRTTPFRYNFLPQKYWQREAKPRGCDGHARIPREVSEHLARGCGNPRESHENPGKRRPRSGRTVRIPEGSKKQTAFGRDRHLSSPRNRPGGVARTPEIDTAPPPPGRTHPSAVSVASAELRAPRSGFDALTTKTV